MTTPPDPSRASPPPPAEEQELRRLLDGVARGDRQAEEELARLVRPTVRGVVQRAPGSVRSLGRDVDAQDVEQEVLALMFRALPRYEHRDRAGFFAWVRRLSENKVSDLRQRSFAAKRGHARTISLDGSEDDALVQAALAARREVELDEASERRERIERVARALAELPEEDREILRLVFFQDQSVRGVARRLGLSEPTARRRAGRAKARVAFLMVRHDRERRARP